MTLHPRDNAMLVATHGRAIWILDHLSPIQEYTAAQAADAKLFSIDPALEWKSFDDKNDEFWGHQYFVGENPPNEAVIQYYLKNAAKDVKLKVTDSLGKDIREITVTGNRLQPGIQSACWDLRVEPLPPAAPAAGGPGGPGGGGAGGRAAGGGRGGRAGGSLPQPEPGYSAVNPCAGGGPAPAGGGGGGGRGGGGASTQGPLVLPGTYNVALMVDGKLVETKPMKVVLDPEIQMTDAQRKRYYEVVMDLHDMQRHGAQVTEALRPLDSQMGDVSAKVKDSKSVPDAVKTQFEALSKEYDGIKEKFGVGAVPAGGGRGGRGGGRGGAGGAAPAGGAAGGAGGGAGAAAGTEAAPGGAQGGGGGGGFGGGGAAPNPNDLVSRAGTVKSAILAFTEMPSETLVKQYNDVKVALPKAIADTNAFLIKAMTMSQTLKKYDITLTVPAPVK
jgi:hypothetical protein